MRILVINGDQAGDNSLRPTLGAAALVYVARTRNGFTPALRQHLFKRFRGLEVGECPFANLPEARSGRWGEGLTADKMNEWRWLRPVLVGQVEFVEWTPDGHLRHARFTGLREDKKARDVEGRRNRIVSRDDISSRLPIIPHESLAANCCGCLVVRTRGNEADILCNDCAATICKVPSSDVEKIMSELARTNKICSVRCTHCGAVNTFTAMSAVDAFICVECGDGVTVDSRVQ